MKARVKTTGDIIELSDLEYDVYGNDYLRTELEIIDEPDYWEKLKHQYAGMAMQGILANCNHQLWERTTNSEPIAKQSYEIATTLVNKLKEDSQCKE